MMNRPSRLGVFGGTFDPVHLGHLRAAESVRELMALDRVVFIPAHQPPHKSAAAATAADRHAMLERAVEDTPYFQVSRVEMDRPGPSYTFDTLTELRRQHPGDAIFFITGADAFKDIRTWKRWEELLRECPFVVHARPGFGLDAAMKAVPASMRARVVSVSASGSGAGAEPATRPALYFVDALTLDISATAIRQLAGARRSIRFLVPDDVEAYILERRLYRDDGS